MKKITLLNPCQIPEAQIGFVMLGVRIAGKWLFCRTGEGCAWELPGVQRKPGQTPEDAARQVMYEITGSVQETIRPVCPYSVEEHGVCTYGMLFFAEADRLPAANCGAVQMDTFAVPPHNLTEPEVQLPLYRAVQNWLNTQSNAKELWDVYDENRQPTGRLHPRGEPLQPGDYHLVVYVWKLNSRGELLITKRSPNKGFGNMWETTAGSAVAGDDSLTAALRENIEETGLALDPDKGSCIKSYRGKDYFADVWLFRQDFDLKDVVLQEGETCDKMYATPAKIRQLAEQGLFVRYSHLQEFLTMVEEEYKK